MKKYAARIYTPGNCGPDQTIVDFEEATDKKAKDYAKRVAEGLSGRLVGLRERKAVS